MKRWSLIGWIVLLAAAVVPLGASANGGGTLTNLALNKTATTGTGSYCAGSETAAQAVDGSTSTKWCHTGTDWLQVDLGAVYSVSEFVLTNAGSENSDYITRDYSIAISANGSAWTTVVDVTNNTTNVVTNSIASVPARYVKLNVTAPTIGGGGAIRIQEFAVNGDPQPQLPAPANVTAVAGDGQATLQWDAVSGADTYMIYKGTAPGSYDANPLDQVNGPGTSYTATGLTNGITYYFAVTAGNAVSGASGYSNEASAVPRSGNADLSGLTIPFATLDPSFSATTYSYTASVPNSVGKIIVTPTKADSNATVTVNGSSASSAVNLEVGTNTVNIVVTAQDGISYNIYTVTVTRTSEVTLVSARSDGDGRTVLTFSEPLKPESIVPEAFLLRIGERPVAVTQVISDPECGDTVKLVASEPLFKWDRVTLDVAGGLLQSEHGSWLAAIESRSVQTDTGALSPDFLPGGVHLDGIMSYLQRRQFDIDANGDGSFDRADIEAMLAHIEP